MKVTVTAGRRHVRDDSLHVVRGRETRARILVAARARILSDGFGAMRLEDVAQDAGVTKAAVVKSIGGKAAILLLLGDEDRQTRMAVLREAIPLRTGLRRRLGDVVRRLLELDVARLNVVMAWIGYMWFWTDDEHRRAQAMVDETRALMCDVIAAAAAEPPSSEYLETVSLRLMGGYVIGLRDLRYNGATVEETVRFIVRYCLD
jgi:AcrR family transcriptional regulator